MKPTRGQKGERRTKNQTEKGKNNKKLEQKKDEKW
jgi:hypothetical protein